ncbi:hypothetical protein FQV27_03070 [Paracoccus aurantiacus]|uniref:Uncharacterized protein n=1 Tax=Paracoccus aurantiacus TaxID=2599412 RepID=A0A5C6S8Y4_9RHOB|nr:hypothetical protein [Paracoccus aurantiacus]TXB70848.1 hypothetical protein FQV27_03070 [Paracoccus aurantiacus]
MQKHRGFPSRLPSTDYQFTIRRANSKGATKLAARERFRDRSPADRRADAGFLAALIDHFGEDEFERGNLDAGRLSWLLGREVLAVGKLDPTSYEQLFRIDMKKAEANFPEIFATDADESEQDDDWNDDWDDDESEDYENI